MAPPSKSNKMQTQRAKPKSRSARAGLVFPVGRVHKFMRKGNFAPRVGGGASVYLAAAIEYLCVEILELAAKAASDNNRGRVSPRHILLAIRNDEELNQLLSGIIISDGGVMPSIHPTLLPRKTMKQKESAPDVSSQEY
ncbi:core histone h2A/H2B/H3/H4 domain-containing protein [Phthorimaea operculella]|nr:core histone h2A/H2B/H3/H4 domain-containing protein [Phthorimaea operculella]